MALEGFEVQGVEIEPHIAELYKHPVIVEDVRNLDPEDFKEYDLIVGSPPCRDFSRMGMMVGHNWKRPPDPEGEGMSLVNAFLRIVKEAEPTYWLMENVPRLEKYLKQKPRVKTYLGESMRRCFWGNFPSFFITRDFSKKAFTKRKYLPDGRNSPVDLHQGKYGKWERAKIPLPVARALGKTVMSQIMTMEDSL